ncbi:MAG TPA: hypothetical protein ENG69_05830 [Candidatus Korarchaeota archaeon]|nr:hypothetical protein [Candidatus Korarchaeota archaeon]
MGEVGECRDLRVADIVRLSLKALLSRKRRAALTLLGVLVGVLTLTAVVSIAYGYSSAVLGVIKLSSPRLVLVIARSDPLTNSDLITLENLPGVKVATPLVMFSISAREGCRIG